jgi:hypothetical protein
MNKPAILRQSAPHQVEVSEGSKDASRRHATERQSEPDSGSPLAKGFGLTHGTPRSTNRPKSQLLPAAVDTSTDRPVDVDFQARLDSLRRKNQSLAQQLAQPRRAGQREDPL